MYGNKYNSGDLTVDGISASKREGQDSAIAHLNEALKVMGLSGDFPFHYDDLTLEHVSNFKFWGQLSTYLGKHAYRYLDESKGLLTAAAACQHLSTITTNLEQRFREFPTPEAMKKEKIQEFRFSLVNEKVEQARVEEKPVCNPRKSANEQDRIASYTVATWDNSEKGACFLHANNTAVQFAGRASEVACQSVKDISTHKVRDNECEYTVVDALVDWIKICEAGMHAVYPD